MQTISGYAKNGSTKKTRNSCVENIVVSRNSAASIPAEHEFDESVLVSLVCKSLVSVTNAEKQLFRRFSAIRSVQLQYDENFTRMSQLEEDFDHNRLNNEAHWAYLGRVSEVRQCQISCPDYSRAVFPTISDILDSLYELSHTAGGDTATQCWDEYLLRTFVTGEHNLARHLAEQWVDEVGIFRLFPIERMNCLEYSAELNHAIVATHTGIIPGVESELEFKGSVCAEGEHLPPERIVVCSTCSIDDHESVVKKIQTAFPSIVYVHVRFGEIDSRLPEQDISSPLIVSGVPPHLLDAVRKQLRPDLVFVVNPRKNFERYLASLKSTFIDSTAENSLLRLSTTMYDGSVDYGLLNVPSLELMVGECYNTQFAWNSEGGKNIYEIDKFGWEVSVKEIGDIWTSLRDSARKLEFADESRNRPLVHTATWDAARRGEVREKWDKAKSEYRGIVEKAMNKNNYNHPNTQNILRDACMQYTQKVLDLIEARDTIVSEKDCGRITQNKLAKLKKFFGE